MPQGERDDEQPRTSNSAITSGTMRSSGPAIGGGLAFVVILLGLFTVGSVSGFEARSLLSSMLPTARFLYSAVITASATILALMLTLLSLSYNSQSTLRPVHYNRVKQIALVDTVTFVTAIAFLLVLVVPLRETDNVPASVYQVYFYVALVGAAILGGLVVSIVLMLYTTVRDMIAIVGLGKEDHPLIETDES